MSFLKGLSGSLAGALGGAINPASGLGMAGGPLSGIGALGSSGWNPITGLLGSILGGGGEGGSGGDAKGSGGDGGQSGVPQVNPGYTPNAAASGLGKLIGADPGKISSIADSVGKGMNMIAEGGGAPSGYAAAPQTPAVNNHMQLLDPRILQALVQHFGGAGTGRNSDTRQY